MHAKVFKTKIEKIFFSKQKLERKGSCVGTGLHMRGGPSESQGPRHFPTSSEISKISKMADRVSQLQDAVNEVFQCRFLLIDFPDF